MYISRTYCKIDITSQMIIEKKEKLLLPVFLILKKKSQYFKHAETNKSK